MTKCFNTLFFTLIVCSGYSSIAQPKFVPTVVALYPGKIKVDSASATELKAYEQSGVVTDKMRKEFLREGLAPNWKTIREKELSFMDQQDFWSAFVLSVSRELTYKEIENRSNLLIYPAKQTTGNMLPAYKKVADLNKVSWVINVLHAETFIQGDTRTLKVSLQLYNVVTNRIFLDKAYIAESTTLSDSENCSDIWLCLSKNVQMAVVLDLTDKIERYIRHER